MFLATLTLPARANESSKELARYRDPFIKVICGVAELLVVSTFQAQVLCVFIVHSNRNNAI